MKTIKEMAFGTGTDWMPDLAFRMMAMYFRVYYFFRKPGKYLEQFGIEPGFTVVDYGCGPGAYIRSVSEKTGPDGEVYAVDVHKLAISSVRKIISRYELGNVVPVLAGPHGSGIPSGTADLIYALDMFHMVSNPSVFLEELKRIVKPGGRLILEDGHQPRSLTKEKILSAGCWRISAENRRFVTCKPV